MAEKKPVAQKEDFQVCSRCGSEKLVKEKLKDGSTQFSCSVCKYVGRPTVVNEEQQAKIKAGYEAQNANMKDARTERFRRVLERIIALLAILALLFFLAIAALISIFGYGV
ncbi:MAG TPA: hypothetical protein VJG83_01730 [archaeon]|nr:hypothetical protein [archaeon]